MDGLFVSSGADAGVATTSTGPREASSAMSGVVRVMSRKTLVWITSEAGREDSACASGAGAVSVTASVETSKATSAPGHVTGASGSVDLQDGQEGLLRYLHRTDLLHPLLSFLLLLEKLALAADVTAVALREHVLPQRLHRRPQIGRA